MKNVIIVGYPKSGNTWLTRLTAELINCPVGGFLYSDKKEIAIEGSQRSSEFKVFKSHHQLHEITEADLKSSKLIYLIRDPRDISVSGRNFFSIQFLSMLNWTRGAILRKMLNLGIKIINHVYRKLAMKRMMNRAILSGNKNINHWCRISWKQHLGPYLQNENVLKVKYESVLKEPVKESKRILDFLGIDKEEQEIKQAIQNQSFSHVKKKFNEQNEIGKANFLRKGKAQQWKTIFSKRENQIFLNSLHKELAGLGYDFD